MYRYLTILLFVLFPLTLSASALSSDKPEHIRLLRGYDALRLFLEDEQYLTTVRRLKNVITFSGINQPLANLVDDIADISETALEELEDLAEQTPVIQFGVLDEASIAVSTLDSMRYATAKTFLKDSENFEKNLLLSQVQILPVIAHLAKQLEELETSAIRKYWLHKLATKYSTLYQRAYAQLVIVAH
ncbi:MAG: hypothetical protein OEX83_08950 [Gammaproteobacteria bacterium]|nr:hypothetical protein [Gammaproteobacteria bacterium]